MRVVSLAGAGTAQSAAVLQHFAFEIYAFAAFGADYPGSFEAGQVFGLDFYLYPLFGEQNFVGKLRVGFLLAGLFGHFREHFASGLLAGFFGGDANGAAGLHVNKGGGHFAPITEFQGALAQAAVGDQRHRVGHAAVDLDVGDDAFAFGDRIVNAQFEQPQHGQPNAQNLPGAQVAVGHGGQVEIFGE